MKPAGLCLIVALLARGADGPHFEISDARGKKPAGVTIEAGEPDADGWFSLKLARGKGDPVLIWPFDGAAKIPDGPEPIPAIAIQRGDVKALANRRVVAAIATPFVLGLSPMDSIAGKSGLDAGGLKEAISGLVQSSDPFEKGVGLLYAAKQAEAADELARALKERQRQLTRVPSEIYATAILCGQALLRQKKFDEAAVAFLVAVKQRPSDRLALDLRSDALVRAGKPEAAGH
ncbi:MAG: hypothetical protein ABSG41_19725 [Bryobacteraceae bacterium]|jgi:tetratricopeptide (TPR) repeat protein